jgi:two-component system KDP operon response regulator KdpE
MSGERVLVVDDEPQIRRLVAVSLRREGYTVSGVGTGGEALDLLATEAFDLLLLDLGLPDMDGVEVCRTLRTWSPVPIIVISVRERESDKVAALDAGADDYVTKPFGIDELLARMRASLRRVGPTNAEPVLTFGALAIDLARRTVTHQRTTIRLTPTEYDLLRVLASHAGRVLTHRQLLREARGPAYEADTPSLRVHMVGLRGKLGVAPGEAGSIMTEPGIGYRLLDAPIS